MKKHFPIFIITIFICFNNYGQLSDLAKIDYTNIPGGNSSIEYNRIRSL